MRQRGQSPLSHEGVAVGREVVVGDAPRLEIAEGARAEIGDGVVIGDRLRLAVHERVTIGAGARLGDDVTILDFDHVIEDVETPIRLQGLRTAPVEIGERAVIGPGATVLRGVRIGAGARVGAHAVVTRDVPPGAVVEGVPASRPH